MNFADLYRFANALGGRNIPFDALSNEILTKHPKVGSIETIPLDLDPGVSRGHLYYELDPQNLNIEKSDALQIRYFNKLNRCYRRFVCAKELMHVFDTSDAMVSDADRLLRLLGELETKPLLDDASPMLKSEINAEWMAVLILCPLSLREKFLERYVSKQIDDAYVANELKVPAVYIRAMMGEYYPTALERLAGISPSRRGKRAAGE